MSCLVFGAALAAYCSVFLFARNPLVAIMKAFGFVAVFCFAVMVYHGVSQSLAPVSSGIASILESHK